MVEYALADVSVLPDPLADMAALDGIPPWRRDYILRYRRAADRRRSLGAWRLLERMLAKRGLRAWDVTVDARGKPICDGAFFSLSHAGGLALCAVGDAPVGCDIEQAADAPFEIAPRVFAPAECAWLRAAQSEGDAQRRFYTLWTLKESYLKMTGEGLALGPQRLELCLRAEALRLRRDGAPQPCTLFHAEQNGYVLSLCAAGPGERFARAEGFPREKA